MRMPGPSTATGFSVNRCLRAATTARMWIGRKPGGVAKRTRSLFWITWRVGVEAGRTDANVGHVDFLGEVAVAQAREQCVGLGAEGVADSGEANVGVGAEALLDRPGAAPAAADQADADGVAALSVDIGEQAQVRGQSSAGHGRCF